MLPPALDTVANQLPTTMTVSPLLAAQGSRAVDLLRAGTPAPTTRSSMTAGRCADAEGWPWVLAAAPGATIARMIAVTVRGRMVRTDTRGRRQRRLPGPSAG